MNTNVSLKNVNITAKEKRYKITAYCSCRKCTGKYGRMTASGKLARAKHTVAVDTRYIKLGTKIKIFNHWYTAEDTGGRVKGRHVDIYMSSHKQVKKFGRKYLRVKVRYKI